jgi:hypothetical protein
MVTARSNNKTSHPERSEGPHTLRALHEGSFGDQSACAR